MKEGWKGRRKIEVIEIGLLCKGAAKGGKKEGRGRRRAG